MRTVSVLFALSLVATPVLAQDTDRSVEGGGVHVDGWRARIDRAAMDRGMGIEDSRMVAEGDAFRLSVGPAGIFWNPANTASGDYTVSATFQEHAMRTSHPHPYGVFIGGSDLRTPEEKLLYCIVYGDGTYAMKTFHGSEVTTIQDRGPSDAINKAGSDGATTNDIGLRVEGGSVSCMINGTAVATFTRDQVVGPSMLDSTDGVYGIRASHNVELTVSDFGVTGGM